MTSDNQSAGVGYATGALLIFAGMLTAPIGFIGFFSIGFQWMGLVMLVMGLSGSLLVYSGIRNISASAKMERELRAAEKKENSTVNKTENRYNNVPQLFHWEFDADAWKQFMTSEKKYRNSDSIYLIIAGILLGTYSLIRNRHADIKTAVLLSAILIVVIAFLRRQLTLRALSTGKKINAVTITDRFVRVNDQFFSLSSENRMLSKVRLITDGHPFILEFTISWQTRSGPTFDELRIPVPEEQKEDVLLYIEKLKTQYRI